MAVFNMACEAKSMKFVREALSLQLVPLQTSWLPLQKSCQVFLLRCIHHNSTATASATATATRFCCCYCCCCSWYCYCYCYCCFCCCR